jgi:hypothetical protein
MNTVEKALSRRRAHAPALLVYPNTRKSPGLPSLKHFLIATSQWLVMPGTRPVMTAASPAQAKREMD